MKIESIYIKRFAGLSERSLELSDGINIIEGPNESGKSTISEFIKFMLYGISGKEEKKHIFGWETGSEKISGSMIVNCSGERYRVERTMGESGRGSCKIIELSGNTIVYEGKNPGDIFLGVPDDVFAHTAFVGQRSGNKIEGGDLSTGIENILFAADENVNTQKALKRLDDARAMLLHKNKHGGKIYELKKELEELELRLERAVAVNGSIIVKEGSVRDIDNKIAENGHKMAELEKNIEYFETGRLKRQYDKIVQYKKELDKERAALDGYADKYMWDGFAPDENYFSEIKSFEEEIRFTERNINLLEKEISETRQKLSESSKETEKLTNAEKEEIIAESAQNMLKKKSYMFIGAVFCLLTIAAGILLAVFALMKSTLPAVFCGVGCAVFAFLALLFFVRAGKYSKADRMLLERYGAVSKDELESILDSMIADNNINIRNEELLSELEQKLERTAEQHNSLTKNLSDLLSKWNMTDADEARRIYAEFCSEGDEHRRRIENLENLYSAAAENFKGVDVQALKRKFMEFEETVPLEQMNYDAMKREYDFIQNAQKALGAKKHEDEKLLAGYYAQAEQPSHLHDMIAETKAKITDYEKKHDAFLLAYEKLMEAGAHMKENISPRLSEYAGRMLGELSGEKYRTLGVGKDFELSYTAAVDGDGFEQTHEVDFMSAGTEDIAYISLRFALIKLLYSKEKPTVIFDDSFVRLDDLRLENMLRLAAKTSSEEDMQIIILTCQKRDSVIMNSVAEHKHIIIG